MKNCCFTGHRNIDAQAIPGLRRKLYKLVIALAEKGVCNFFTGGALGFDTLAAQAVLKVSERYPQVSLILVLPCKEQTKGWPNQDVEVYEEIKLLAKEVIFVSEHYFRGCMQKRNRVLVDRSDICVYYCQKNVGGTAYTMSYGAKKGIKLIDVLDEKRV